MNILVLADIDDLHWNHGTGQVDVVLSCGDIADQVILEAAEAFACKTIYAVKGNHDRNVPFMAPIADLHLQIRHYGGFSFGGLNGSWKYMPRGNFLYDQLEVEGFLTSFPPVDIFICHNSPRGVHEREDDVHIGFDGLNLYITKMRPKVMFHGHQHVNRETQVHETRVIGVYGHKVIEIY
jgi:uncharacterized protein